MYYARRSYSFTGRVKSFLLVAMKIANYKKSHTITESLLAAIEMFGEEAAKALKIFLCIIIQLQGESMTWP